MAEAKISGGAYVVEGQWVNANGEPLSGEQVEVVNRKAALEKTQADLAAAKKK